jgi:NhaP-type Na+/H+ or K+/H+ antiporter
MLDNAMILLIGAVGGVAAGLTLGIMLVSYFKTMGRWIVEEVEQVEEQEEEQPSGYDPRDYR